jgi:hypothetical protein
VLFAFHPFRIDHYAHLQMQMTQFMPIGLWALHRTIAGGRIRDGLLTGFFVASNALSCICYGVFFGAYIAVVGIALLAGIKWWRSAARRSRSPGAALCLAILIPLSPVFPESPAAGSQPRVVQIRAPSRRTISPRAPTTRSTDDSAVSAGRGAPLPGLLAIVLAIVGFWGPLSRVRIAWLVALLFAFDASLGFNRFTYPLLYKFVLPFRGLRVPARMGFSWGCRSPCSPATVLCV